MTLARRITWYAVMGQPDINKRRGMSMMMPRRQVATHIGRYTPEIGFIMGRHREIDVSQ